MSDRFESSSSVRQTTFTRDPTHDTTAPTHATPIKQHVQTELDRPLSKLHTNESFNESVKYSSFKLPPPSVTETMPSDLNKSSPLRSNEPTSDFRFAQSIDENVLKPGPPPEFGFVPEPNRMQNETLRSEQRIIETTRTFASSPEAIYRPASASAQFIRSPSPRPSAEAVRMEKMWSSPKPFEHRQSPAIVVETENMRRSSIRETARAIENKVREIERSDYELKAPGLVRNTLPAPFERTPIKLEAGPAPEICYSQPMTFERRPSLVENLERSVAIEHEQNSQTMQKPISCPVRTMPPSPQGFTTISASPMHMRESSGYVADTEETRQTTQSQRYETRSSAREYFQRIDQSRQTPNISYSPYESDTNTGYQSSVTHPKVRNRHLCPCAFSVCSFVILFTF